MLSREEHKTRINSKLLLSSGNVVINWGKVLFFRDLLIGCKGNPKRIIAVAQ